MKIINLIIIIINLIQSPAYNFILILTFQMTLYIEEYKWKLSKSKYYNLYF